MQVGTDYRAGLLALDLKTDPSQPSRSPFPGGKVTAFEGTKEGFSLHVLRR